MLAVEKSMYLVEGGGGVFCLRFVSTASDMTVTRCIGSLFNILNSK